MSERELRRRSLVVFGCGIAAAHLTNCGGSSSAPLPTTIGAGAASSLSVGSIHAVANEPVAIARDSQGIYAMSLICTHQGCDMSGGVSTSGIDCPCHASVFDLQGNVLRGPANQPLSHYAVTADAAGQLTIHTDQVVPASTRLNV